VSNMSVIGAVESATSLLVSGGGVALIAAGHAGTDYYYRRKTEFKKESRKCKLIIASERSPKDVMFQVTTSFHPSSISGLRYWTARYAI
jgi:hypothetical protein